MISLGIGEAIREETAKRIHSYPARSIWASRLGHPCERHLVMAQLNPNDAAPHGVDLQSIFDLGSELEKYVLRRMDAAGIQVIRAQEPLEWRDKGFLITGRVDGMVVDPGGQGEAIPIEIKSCSANNFRLMTQAEDIVATMLGGPHYMQCYPAQLMLYAWSKGKSRAAWIFCDKVTGIIKDRVIEIELPDHVEYMESLLLKAARVGGHVAAHTYPDRIDDWEVCADCGWQQICYPGKSEEDKLALIDGMAPILDEIAALTAGMKPGNRRLGILKEERDKRIEGREGIVIAGDWRGKKGKKSWSWKRVEGEDGPGGNLDADTQDRR